MSAASEASGIGSTKGGTKGEGGGDRRPGASPGARRRLEAVADEDARR